MNLFALSKNLLIQQDIVLESRRSDVTELFNAGKTRSQISSSFEINKMFVSRTLSSLADTGSVVDRQRPVAVFTNNT